MKKILVPIDFSQSSIDAFRFALDMAHRSHGSIVLLHVIALPVLRDTPILRIGELRKPLGDELKGLADKKLGAIIDEFNVRKIDVETLVVIFNDVHKAIIESAKKAHADLVIMGTRGTSGIREWMIGSNAERVVRTSPVPVLAIKEYKAGHSIRNIVFPTALEIENQEDIVMKIKALQDFFQAHLHIIWVNTPAIFKSDPEIRKQLAAFAQRYKLKNFTINVFNYSTEEAGILEFTRHMDGDLIAIVTHGLTGVSHLLAGSLAEDVVNHVDLPVWTYSRNSVSLTTT